MRVELKIFYLDEFNDEMYSWYDATVKQIVGYSRVPRLISETIKVLLVFVIRVNYFISLVAILFIVCSTLFTYNFHRTITMGRLTSLYM